MKSHSDRNNGRAKTSRLTGALLCAMLIAACSNATSEQAQSEPQVPSLDVWCAVAAELNAIDAGYDADESTMRATQSALDSARRVAPKEIADHVLAAASSHQVLIDELVRADWEALDLDLGLMASVAETQITAQFAIARYNAEECGFVDEFNAAAVPTLRPTLDVRQLAGKTTRQVATERMLRIGYAENEADCLIAAGILRSDISTARPELNRGWESCGITHQRIVEIFGKST